MPDLLLRAKHLFVAAIGGGSIIGRQDSRPLARQKIDRVFGSGHARQHPEVVVAVMQTAASDWAASRLAVAIERVPVALLAEDEEMQNGAGIVRATTVMRP